MLVLKIAAGIVVGVIVLAVGLAATATAAPAPNLTPAQISRCLQLTNTHGLDTAAITRGIGLTPDQVREVRGRLSQYFSIRGFPGFAGLGLTAEQIAEMKRRIAVQVAAMNRYPLGWPCAPFKNRTLVVKFMRAKLTANGFRQTPMNFYVQTTRRLRFEGVQDGVSLNGLIVKSGPRQITVRLIDVGTYTFAVPFDA